MTMELLPLRKEHTTDHGIGFEPWQDIGDGAEQDDVSLGYNVLSLTHGLESLSKSSAKSDVDEQIHLVPRDKPCIDRTRPGYEEDSFLPATSFSTTSQLRRIWKHVWVALLAIILLVVTSMCLMVPSMCLMVEHMHDLCDYETGSSKVFLIDVAFGTLPFSLAKFIDVAWDVLVGRGGQAFLGWITYRVCTDSLMWIMESDPVSYDLYITLTFSWTSIVPLSPLLKFSWTRNRFAHKMVMVMLAIDIIWVGIHPSVMGAMTGYIANNDFNVRLRDGKYVSWADFVQSEPVYECGEICVAPLGGTTFRKDSPNTTLWEELNVQDNSRHFPAHYFLYALRTSPPLHYVQFRLTHLMDNTTYEAEYPQQPGVIQCIANNTYRWGFSTNFIYLAAAGNMFWVVSTYSIWVHANRKSELCKKGRRLGKYRAAMDMAGAVGEDLGPNTCAYNDKELETVLRRRPPIKYGVWPPIDENGTEDRPAHIGLSSARQEGAVVLRFGQTYGHL